MAYIIAEPCIGTLDKSCVEACPVDCIYEIEGSSDQLFFITQTGKKWDFSEICPASRSILKSSLKTCMTSTFVKGEILDNPEEVEKVKKLSGIYTS